MVVLVSDIHFLRENHTGINKLLEDCAKDEDKVIVIGGDLTQSGSEESYAKANNFIKTLKEMGMTVVVTAGNHDMGGSKNGEKLGKNEQARTRFKKMIEPIFQQPQVIHHSTYDSITKIGDRHIFVSLRSSHKGFYFGLTRATQGPRIKLSQIQWAAKFLEEMEKEMNEKLNENSTNDLQSIDQNNKKPLVLGDKYVITLVMHHNIWQDTSDKHSSVDGRNKLEKQLLRRFKFSILVCGHNHRLCFANTTTPKTHFRMYRCSLPTLSSRRREYESGYLTWKLSEMGTNIGPILTEFENEAN